MRVDRLAIIGVLGDCPVKNKETKKSVLALEAKYEKGNPNLPIITVLVRLGKTLGTDDWDPQEDTVEDNQGAAMFAFTPGRLGVYVLAHGALVGLADVPDAGKFYGMLNHLNLLQVEKLCLVACMGACGNDNGNPLDGSPSTLGKLCKFLGEKGYRPKMAGWNDFVTVVNERLFNKPDRAVLRPWDLGTYAKKDDSGPNLDPSDHIGKKALNGPRTAKILASNRFSQNINAQGNRTPKKKFYLYGADGVSRIGYEDWTDKVY